jgi:metal-dependent hydrolase (beta-lactamase superfamily II)
MVDPPPFSIQRLKRMGVASRLIEGIIISHCHGDHDAGVFQKVLDTQQIEVTYIFSPTRTNIVIDHYYSYNYEVIHQEVLSHSEDDS